jgi:hypothetical protein
LAEALPGVVFFLSNRWSVRLQTLQPKCSSI